jgi:hypothetical protein
MEELKDIKPEIVIVNSFLIDTLFFAFIIVLVGLLGYFIYRFMKKERKKDKRKLSVLYLKSFDFENLEDKQIAYEFTKHGYITLEEHFCDEFFKILKQLEPFKYKQEVPKIDDDLKGQMKDYIKVRIR